MIFVKGTTIENVEAHKIFSIDAENDSNLAMSKQTP